MYKRLVFLISILFFASFAAGPAVAEPNLVACWDFDDGTADDSSGNAHHGTFVGGAGTVYDSDRDSNVLELIYRILRGMIPGVEQYCRTQRVCKLRRR